jgi:hypothetical protein
MHLQVDVFEVKMLVLVADDWPQVYALLVEHSRRALIPVMVHPGHVLVDTQRLRAEQAGLGLGKASPPA